MPEPDADTEMNQPCPTPVKAGLGIDDIRHIPACERELRFTRNRAGARLLAAGLLLIAVAVFLQLTGHDVISPYLPAPLPLMQAAVLLPAALCLYLGWYCLKHAAVIVTPLGVEILPLLRPRKRMTWYIWQQIRSVECTEKTLALTLSDGIRANIRLGSLTPASRTLLAHAVQTRLSSLQEAGYGAP